MFLLRGNLVLSHSIKSNQLVIMWVGNYFELLPQVFSEVLLYYLFTYHESSNTANRNHITAFKSRQNFLVIIIIGDLSFYGKTTNILDFVNSHILKVWKLGYGKRIKFFSCWNLVVFFLKKKDQFILYENKSKTIINICSGERQKQAMVRKHLHSSVEIKIEVVNADFPWKSCH